MGVYDAAKDALAIARKLDDADLVQKILDLQSQALEMQDESRRLRDEIRELEDRLSLRGMEFRDGMYWDGEDGPFCPNCVDAEGTRARVGVHFQGNWRCNVCGKIPVGAPKPARR